MKNLGLIALCCVGLSILLWSWIGWGEESVPPRLSQGSGKVGSEPDTSAATLARGAAELRDAERANVVERAAPKDAPATLLVRVRTAGGSPVPDARIWAGSPGRLDLIGTTDEAGALAADARACVGAWIEARSNLHGVAGRWAPPSVAGELVLVLRGAGSIVGRVEWRHGGGGIGQATVLAWRADHGGHLRDPAVLRSQPAGFDGTHSWCRTADDGAFVLEGLVPDIEYRLTASKRGAVPDRHGIVALPGSAPIAIPMDALYATRVVLTEPGGAPLRVSPQLMGGGFTWGVEDDQFESLFFARRRQALRLAGLEEQEDLLEPTLWVRGPGGYREGAVVEYTVRAPGYREVSDVLRVRPVVGEIESSAIELEPISEGWGRVDVVVAVDQASRAAVDASPEEWLGILHLSRGTEVMYVHLPKSSAGGLHTVDGVPFGAYTARFESLRGGYQHPDGRLPGLEFRLDASSPTVELPVVLEGLGLIDVQATDASGRPYEGELSLRILDGENRSQFWISFDGPPFRVGPLPVGTWRVARQTKFETGITSAHGFEEVDVVEGGLSPLEITLP